MDKDLGVMGAQVEKCVCRYDYFRTLRLATYGGAIAGPLGHYWFSFLDARIFPHVARRSAKVLTDCILPLSRASCKDAVGSVGYHIPFYRSNAEEDLLRS